MTPLNEKILNERANLFAKGPGPAVGDYITLPPVHPRLGRWTRITHVWEDSVQTGGMGGSYHLGEQGYMSYSGGLDSGVPTMALVPCKDPKMGPCWFFDGGWARAGGGVNAVIQCRVFSLKAGTNLEGIGELQCPLHLTVLNKEAHERTAGYWFIITKRAMSHTAFKTKEELTGWLQENQVTPVGGMNTIPEAGTLTAIKLQYVGQTNPWPPNC
jgi:hypothetical protein